MSQILSEQIVQEVARWAEAGLRQSEIASCIGVAPTTLSRWKKRGEEVEARREDLAKQAEKAVEDGGDPDEWAEKLDPESLPEMERLYLGVARELAGGNVRLRRDIMKGVAKEAKSDPHFGIQVLNYLDRRDAARAGGAAIEVEVEDGRVSVRSGLSQDDLEDLAEQATRMQIQRREEQRARLAEEQDEA